MQTFQPICMAGAGGQSALFAFQLRFQGYRASVSRVLTWPKVRRDLRARVRAMSARDIQQLRVWNHSGEPIPGWQGLFS